MKEEAMTGSGGVQLFRRIIAPARERPDRSDRRRPLRSEHFPVRARGREIVIEQGVVIATTADLAMSEEIARRLNESDFRSEEDRWAL
jgi:hypothetical protein